MVVYVKLKQYLVVVYIKPKSNKLCLCTLSLKNKA